MVLFLEPVGHWKSGQQIGNERHSVLELYPIIVGLIMWGDKLTNQRVFFFSDNESVVHVINKQTTNDKALLALLGQLVLACLRYNILFKARHSRQQKHVG